MEGHGIPRTQRVGERSEDDRRREERKIDEYKALVEAINEKLSSGKFDAETLRLTSSLLQRNPEYYTIWNNRRRIFQYISQGKDSSTINGLLSDDLEFLMPLLVKYPKCYWLWNHRLWLLQQTSIRLGASAASTFWQNELQLVSKLLASDSRNFHAWDYRRTVVAQLESLPKSGTEALENKSFSNIERSSRSLAEEEFSYTTKKISANLSNFSAWHNRSKLIPRLLDERKATDFERQKTFEEELKLIKKALSTDPYDQSLWFYHQFLMSAMMAGSSGGFMPFTSHQVIEHLESEISFMRELLDDTHDCKWVYKYLLIYTSKCREIDGETEFVTTDEMRYWMSQLKNLDTLRAGKWESMETTLGI